MKTQSILDELLIDNCERRDILNTQQVFDYSIDYANQIELKEEAVKKWSIMDELGKQGFSGKIDNLFKSMGIIDKKDSNLAKNYWLIISESEERIKRGVNTDMLPLTSIYLDQSLLDLLENLENTRQIQELYKIKKLKTGPTKNAGIAQDEAIKLRNCLRQGRELYLAARTGSLMVKPLNFFYSLTAYSYAVILLNNPLRYSMENLPASHGLVYANRASKSQFGGDMPHGTLSELLFAFPTIELRNNQIDFIQDNVMSLKEFFSHRYTTSLSTLMSMVPELRDYYRLVTKQSGRTHPLEITQERGVRGKLRFHVGDGENQPHRSDLEQSFPDLEINERHGKLIVDIAINEVHKIRASIFVDSGGGFWYSENPFYPVVLPEMCLHFIIMNSLSNIMRYSPDQWGDILSNESNSGASLIIKRYLSSFEGKFPFIILRNMSKYYPYVMRNA